MFPWRLVPRAQPLQSMLVLAPLLAVLLTLVVGLGIFAALGQNPLTALRVFFIDPLTSINGVSELLLKAAPLCLIALGLAVGFRANIWNIGAEGQMYLGGIFATGLGIAFHESNGGGGGAWLLPAMIVAGALGGALWAGITAFLRAHLNTNEILVSLMLTYVADLLVKYLVFGPWQDPQSNNFPFTVSFGDDALFPLFMNYEWLNVEGWLDGTRLNLSLLMAVVAVPVAWLFMEKSFIGFQLSVAGTAPAAARYAGYSQKRLVWIALLIGGAAAGLAGVSEVAGPIGQLNDRWTPGYGFTAIIVAALGRMKAGGIVLASLLMALLYLGGEAAQISLQLPKAISQVFQGLLLMFLLGCDVLVNYRVEKRQTAGDSA